MVKGAAVRENGDDYRDLGHSFGDAFEILVRQTAIPPSLEVFARELERNKNMTPQQLAYSIAGRYKPRSW